MFSLKTKRILYICAFLVFFICVPIIIGYSSGFRINWNNFRIFKTGLLYLETIPRLVKIDIGGKTMTKLTPYRANNLYPGNYIVSIHKDGYYSWQKEVSIQSGESTLYKNIRLFPISTPRQLISKIKNTKDYNKHGIIFETDSEYEYYMYDDSSPRITIPKTTISKPPILNRTENALIYKKDDVYIIEKIGITRSINKIPEKTNETNIRSEKNIIEKEQKKEDFRTHIQEIYWANTDTVIYIDDNNTVFGYTINDSQPILLDKKKNQKDIYFKWGGNFYKITNDDDSSFVQELTEDASWNTSFILPKSLSITYRYDIMNSLLNLLDTERNIWYQLHPQTFTYSIIQNASCIQPLRKDTTSYYNDHEVFSIKDSERPVLLTRSSIPIKRSFILPDQSYFFILYANGDLTINENDTKGKRNIITIANSVEDFFVHPSFSKIYIIKEDTLLSMSIE